MKQVKRSGITTKYIVIFGALLLLTIIVLGIVMMTQSNASIKKMVQKNMLDITNTAAGILDGDALGSLTEDDVGGKVFKSILDELTVFQKNNNIKYIYTVKKIGNDAFVFLVDADPENPADFGEEVLVTNALRQAGNGIAAVDDEPAADEWGNYYSAYSPVFDSNGNMAGIVGVDFDAIWYEEYMTSHIISTSIITGIAILIGIAIFVLFTRNIDGRIRALDEELTTLSNDVDELAEELVSNAGHKFDAEVTRKAQKYSKEDISDGDEIETLGGKIKGMHNELKLYLNYAHAMAYTDGLTGIGNTTAYIEVKNGIDQKIVEKTASFSLVVFDINSLKIINDKFGHAIGDKIIKGAAACVEKAFGIENVFRIGGDEFLAILENVDDEKVKEKMKVLNEEIEKYNDSTPDDFAQLSISKGLAEYNPDIDKSFKDVFVRADEIMYKEKEEFHK